MLGEVAIVTNEDRGRRTTRDLGYLSNLLLVQGQEGIGEGRLGVFPAGEELP